MKYLLTAIACCLAVACFGQGTTIHEYPWNPDWNNDNFVGSSDLTGFLSAFGSEFGNPPEPCDYDGTTLEEFFLGLIGGEVILDSMFVEFQIEDVASFYVPGCPELITDTVQVTEYGMLTNLAQWGCNGAPWGEVLWAVHGEMSFGPFSFVIYYVASSNEFQIGMNCAAHAPYQSDGFFADAHVNCAETNNHALPFPDTWEMNENGIQLDDWSESSWMQYSNYIHILPYWHYAE